MDNARKVALYSVGVNIALTLVKGWLAVISGSAAVLSETLHSLADVIGSLSVWIGIKLSRVKSPKFPWGLYKIENIAAVVSALLIFLIAYEVTVDSFKPGTKEVANIGRSVSILGFLAIPVLLFARYEQKTAKRLNSPSLLADARHWLTDIGSMTVVMGGLALSGFIPIADRIAALIVIVFVLKIGYGILTGSMKSLLDASVNSQTLQKIRETIAGFDEVREITALNARNSGSFIFVHCDVRLDVKRLRAAHDVADAIEDAVKKGVPFIERVSIHYEPAQKEVIKIAAPLADRRGNISPHFGSAPFIALWERRLSDGSIISREILENPFINEEKGKGIKLAELLIEKGVDRLYVKEQFSGKGPEHVFSDAEIKVARTDFGTLEELIGS